MRSQGRAHKRQTGFTVVELVVVIVVLAVIAVFAATSATSPAETTLPSQAEQLARDIRHTQMLAATWGKALRIRVTPGVNGNYSVCCVAAGVCVVTTTAPCNANPVVDPATGVPFSRNLQKNAELAGPGTLDFNSLGTPSAAATYTLTVGTVSKTVTVQALTGFAAVPP